jgi:hypothetical protein
VGEEDAFDFRVLDFFKRSWFPVGSSSIVSDFVDEEVSDARLEIGVQFRVLFVILRSEHLG